MAAYQTLHDTERVRNIALIGHAGSGKTTLLEALLDKTGSIRGAGQVEKGTTISDFTEQEKQHKHSLDPAVCYFEHDGVFVDVLDTPGYPDFSARSMSVLSGVDSVALVINAQMGVEMVAQRMMRFAEQHQMCRMIIINKIDADGVNCQAVLDQVREAFGKECLPLNLPSDHASKVADCFFTLSSDAPDFSSRNTNAPQTMILSTNGSRIRPNVVTRPYLRAMQPSRKSVAAAAPNSTADSIQ